MKKWVLLSLAGVVLATGGGYGFVAWRSHVTARQIDLREIAIRKALAEHHGRPALALLEDIRRESAGHAAPEQQQRWQAWELQACVEARDIRRLLAMYERSPAQVKENEDASLFIARALLAAGRAEIAANLREAWRGRERDRAAWLAYDADLLLRDGQPEEAKTLLASQKNDGAADCSRLLRLAMLSSRQPNDALKYLEAAYRADPRNPDLRTYRGQMLERVGQSALARVEYTAALLTAPANPLLRDQLGEFYLRQRDFPMAVQTFADGQDQEAGDFLHFKAEFWSSVTSRGQAKLSPTGGSPGALQPLSQMLAALPLPRFFDQQRFDALRGARAFQASRQEVFWLRLLQSLQDGQESSAIEQLATNRFRNGSFEPELEQALLVVLRYRLNGTPPALDAFGPATRERHPFIQQLVEWSKGTAVPDLEKFVTSPEALAGVLMSYGWVEAALRLAPDAKTLAAAPEWYRYGLVQAARLNRNPQAALALARACPPTPLLTLATGELQLGAGNEAAGTASLQTIARDASDAGDRAAWLLATRALERKDFDAARAVVEAQPRLSGTVHGQELLARLTLAEGKPDEAATQYQAIAESSAEAKAFLARRAFAAKRWDEARQLTEQLIALYPDEMTLRQNLLAIERAAQ